MEVVDWGLKPHFGHYGAHFEILDSQVWVCMIGFISPNETRLQYPTPVPEQLSLNSSIFLRLLLELVTNKPMTPAAIDI